MLRPEYLERLAPDTTGQRVPVPAEHLADARKLIGLLPTSAFSDRPGTVTFAADDADGHVEISWFRSPQRFTPGQAIVIFETMGGGRFKLLLMGGGKPETHLWPNFRTDQPVAEGAPQTVGIFSVDLSADVEVLERVFSWFRGDDTKAQDPS